jgi:hypothetical protein
MLNWTLGAAWLRGLRNRLRIKAANKRKNNLLDFNKTLLFALIFILTK